jgi:hypothetical protein
LASFEDLHGLRYLDLHNAQAVSDEGLVHLKGPSNLAELDLQNNPRITDAGLEHLQGNSSLRVLSLSGTAVTDRGVEHLQRCLPNLVINR